MLRAVWTGCNSLMSHRVGIDIGGTFTDFALLDISSGRIATHKRLTTPAAPARGVLEGLSDLLVREQVPVEQLEAVIHGTTLITNAVIERKGARIGMITTAGFADVLEMANEHRYEMFDLRITYPAPLVERSCRVEINERIRYDGHVETVLTQSEVRLAVRHLVEQKGIESLAVCFLHSYANSEHERQVRDIARADYPEHFVSISSEVFPDIREFSRWTTTCINAYTQPLLDRYLHDLEQGLYARQIRAPLFIMTSSGGTATPAIARNFPVRIMESGPAAGVLMSARHGEMLSINVFITNRGNAHATDVNIILCKDQSPSDIKRNGCDENNVVYRQIVKAIMPIGQSDTEEANPITLLYMVEAGNHEIVVVVDPDNNIVETDETNNIMAIDGGEMSSTWGALDVGVDIVAKYSVPVIIVGATFSLVGVAGYVVWGRRVAALARFAELSSLMPGIDDDDMVF